MQFTTDNLLDNLHLIGPWSQYGLATIALQYYFPTYYDESNFCDPSIEVQLLQRIGCSFWRDVIIKYHKVCVKFNK